MFTVGKKDAKMVTIKWYMDNLKCKIKINELQIMPDYKEEDLESIISGIMSHVETVPIVIDGNNEIIDGHKRISAINLFVDNIMKCNGQYYSELSVEEKEIFDSYHLAIVFV